MPDLRQPKIQKKQTLASKKQSPTAQPIITPNIQSETLTPERVLQLQHTIGNAAVQQLLNRQSGPPPGAPIQRAATKEEAGNLTDALALVDNKAPLHQLNTELAKDTPDVDKCLKYIGMLGAGQRKIVGNDEGKTGLMRKMATCMTDKQMFTAVRLLGPANVDAVVGLSWAFYWITQAKDAGANIGDAAFEELIMGASKAAVIEMMQLTLTLQPLLKRYTGSLLHLVTTKIGGPELIADMPTWGEYFVPLLFTKDKTTAITALHYVAANDPKGMTTALHAIGKWMPWVQLLPAGRMLEAAEQSALYKIFTALDDLTLRERLYRLRFIHNPVMTDWPGTDQGDSAWKAREAEDAKQAYTGRVEKYIVNIGGEEKERKRNISLWTDLSTALNDVKTTPQALGSIIYKMTDAQRKNVVANTDLLTKIQTKIKGNKSAVTQFLRYLNLSGIPALEFIKATEMDGAGALDRSVYDSLLHNFTLKDLQTMLSFTKHHQVVTVQASNPLLIPSVGEADNLAKLIKQGNTFLTWVLAKAGPDTLLNFISTHNAANNSKAASLAQWQTILAALPTGAQIIPDTRKAMLTIFDNITAIDIKILLTKKRFNFTSIDQEGGTNWEAVGLKRAWELMERLPPEHVSENAWFTALKRTGKGNHSGVTGGHRVGMKYDEAQMAKVDTGEFTDLTDTLRGKSLFDAVLVHEIGHAVDFEKDYSGPLEKLQTDAKMGAWKSYTNTNKNGPATSLMNAMIADSKEALPAGPHEADYTKMTWLDAIKKRRTPVASATWILANVEPFKSRAPAETWYINLYNNKVKNLKVTDRLAKYWNSGTGPWNTSFNDPLDKRAYHSGYEDEWSSYLIKARDNGKISKYQFRDHMEYFAETYATFYLTPNDPGKLLRDKSMDDLYNWFVKNVDKGYSTQFKEN